MKSHIIFITILAVMLLVFNNEFFSTSCMTDFLAYWSSSHILVTGGNPYDPSALSQLEQSTCHDQWGGITFNTWNPPWLLQIFAPLGLLPYHTATLAWTFINAFIIGLALILSWQLCVGASDHRSLLYVFLAGYLFVQSLTTVRSGQISSLVLLSLLLLIRCLDRKLDFSAGFILLFAFIKPQITYFFLLILLIWIISHRRWMVIAGFITALSASLVLQWIIIPSWVSGYITLLRSMPYYSLYTSTLGSFLYFVLHIRWFYYSAIVLVIFIKPILILVKSDGWLTVMNLTMLLALPLSPFGFSFDQIVLLPVIAQIITWLWSHPDWPNYKLPISLGLALFYILDVYLHSIHYLEQYWFFMLPYILLPIYLLAWRKRPDPQKYSYGS